jgi:hypothetical protein
MYNSGTLGTWEKLHDRIYPVQAALVWSTEGVQRVIRHVTVAGFAGFGDFEDFANLWAKVLKSDAKEK